MICNQGLYSLSGKTSYRKISWGLEAARFELRLFSIAVKPDRHHGSSAAEMHAKFQNGMIIIYPISRLQGFTRFDGKKTYRLVNRGTDFIYRDTRGLVWKKTLVYRVRVRGYISLCDVITYPFFRHLYPSKGSDLHNCGWYSTNRTYRMLRMLLPSTQWVKHFREKSVD